MRWSYDSFKLVELDGSPEQMLEQVRRALAPEVLRAEIDMYQAVRESYVPGTLSVSTPEQMTTELSRYHEHVLRTTLPFLAEYPEMFASDVRGEVSRFLDKLFSGGTHTREMEAWRLVQREGMRALLDRIAKAYEDQWLDSYLGRNICIHIGCMSLEQRDKFLQLYLNEFRSLGDTEYTWIFHEQYAVLIKEHARNVLKG